MNWRESYLNYYMNDNPKYQIIKGKQLDLINGNLYKYFSDKDYNFDALENKQIWFSNVIDYNDPFEFHCNRLTSFLNSKEQIDTIIKDNPDMYLKTIEYINSSSQNIKQKLQNTFSISCFTQTNNNKLMWSHYTNSYKGFCVQYSIKDELKFLHPIYYTNQTPSLRNNPPPKDPYRFLLSKDAIWSYENEWRYILPIESTGLNISPNPIAIYLGINFNSNNLPNMINIAKKLNTKLFKMSLSYNTYEVIFKQII